MSISSTSSQKSLAKTQNERAIKVDPPSSHKLFPYVSLMQRVSNIPHFFHHFTFLFICLQSVGISIWLIHQESNSDLQEYLSLILLFSPLNTVGTTYDIVIIAFSCISILSCVVLLFPMAIFEKTQRVIRWLLPIQDFLAHILSPIIAIPLCSHFGIGVVHAYLNSGQSKYIILLILTAIGCLVNIAMIYYSISFSSNTVFFLNSEYVITNHRIILVLIIGQGIFAIFSFVSSVLGYSIEISDLVLHVLFAIVMVVCGFLFAPFLFSWVNIVFCGMAVSSAVMDIASRFIDDLRIRIAFSIGGVIIYSIIFKFSFDYYAKRIMKDDTGKYFDLKIHFTLLYDQDSFLSGKLFDSLSPFITNSSNRLQIAKFACFFPEFQPVFTAQIAMLRNSTDLTFAQSFLYYQLRIVETGRQPLSSVEELVSLRQETLQTSTSIRTIWSRITSNGVNFMSFERLSQDITLARNHWDEALSKYPRNALIAENYSRYLLEVESNFEKCAEWHYRALQLQNGRIFEYDNAILHFLRLFPRFAKKLVSGITLASVDDLDIKTSEELLGHFIKQPKLHLEYQKALQHFVSGWQNGLMFLVGFRFIVLFVYWAVMLTMFTGMFISRQTHMQFVYDLSLICESVELSDIVINFQGAKEYNEMPTQQQIQTILGPRNVPDIDPLINFSNPLFSSANQFNTIGTKRLNNFISEINGQSATGFNLQIIVDKLNLKTLNITFFHNNIPIVDVKGESFRSLITFFFSTAEMIAHSPLPNPSMNSWVFSGTISELNYAFPQILRYLDEMMDSFVENDGKDVEANKKLHMIIAIVVNAICISLFIILYIICFVCFRKSFCKLVKTCNHLSANAVHKASSTLGDVQTENVSKQSAVTLAAFNSTTYVTIIIFVLEIIITLVAISSTVAFYAQVVSEHTSFDSMSQLLKNSCLRSTYSLMIFNDFLKGNLVDCPGHETDINKILIPFDEAIKLFSEMHENCLKGDYGKGAVGRRVDSIRRESPCSENDSNSNNNVLLSEHDNYACMSMDAGAAEYVEMVKLLKNKICTRRLIETSQFFFPFHFLNAHLYKQLQEVNELLLQLGKEKSNQFDSLISNIGTTVLIISVAVLCIASANIHFMNQTNKTLITFLLRIPPIDAVGNAKLMDKVLGRKSMRKQAKMTLFAKIVKNSNFPIIFINKNLVIENVNQSFIVYFGYDISQIIGQQMSMMSDDPNFTNNIMKIRKAESFEIDLKKENKEELHCELTIVPVYSAMNNGLNNNGSILHPHSATPANNNVNEANNYDNQNILIETFENIEFYGLILRDLSSLITKKRQCELLKESNDQLVDLMYPKLFKISSSNSSTANSSRNTHEHPSNAANNNVNIISNVEKNNNINGKDQKNVNKNNDFNDKKQNSENNASSEIKNSVSFESAVVLCLKLVHYGGNLTPAVFTAQRQNIFSKFNSILEKQDLLTRVSINNGEYIVVGSGNTTEAAHQCIEFSIEATTFFDDPAFFGDYVIGIDIGDVSLFLSGDEKRKQCVINGSAIKNSRQLMRISNSGEIAISEKVYRSIATMNLQFSKMSNTSIGTYYLVNIPNDDQVEEIKAE